MDSETFNVHWYELDQTGLFIILEDKNSGDVYHYFESLGTIDVTDDLGEVVGGEIYDMIYEFVEENTNTLIELYDE